MPYSQLKQKRSTTIKSGLSFNSLKHPMFTSFRPYGIDPVKLPTSKVHRLLSIFSMSSLRGVTLPVSRAWKLECSFYGACSSSSWSFTSVGDTCSSCDLKLKRNYCHWAEQVTWNRVWSKCMLSSLESLFYTLRKTLKCRLLLRVEERGRRRR